MKALLAGMVGAAVRSGLKPQRRREARHWRGRRMVYWRRVWVAAWGSAPRGVRVQEVPA